MGYCGLISLYRKSLILSLHKPIFSLEEVPAVTPLVSTTSRILAAVMFADMTGFTAMMQEDEQKAKSHRDRMRQALEKYIPQHQGRIIQYYGDGTLSIFSSAIESVKCAINIQQELQQEPKVLLRIGLHSGDVVVENDDIYGDSVNIASRIEALAIPGAVLISDKLQDEIKNQIEIKTKSLGKFVLKNVKQQVEVFAIVGQGMTVPTEAQTGVKAGSDKSIAVLPFINMSADPENEYFSDGIAEEILNGLSRVDGLQVCSRTSSFTFKGKNKDVRTVGQKLGVSSVLEGSVRRAGNKVRISVQLSNTSDGYHVWSEVFDGDLDDIFKVQDEISHKIVTRLKENFALKSKDELIIKPATENLEAYNLHLKGLFHRGKSNPEEIRKAIVAFEDAIRLDPEFMLPYCNLSYCYSFLGSSGVMPRQEAFSKAKDCTLKAIELDPNHPESHLALATIKFFQNWDFKGAETSIEKAIDLGLNSSLLHQVHGMLLIALGKFDEAIEKMIMALKQDPLSLPLISQLADAYCFAGQFEKALEQYDQVIEIDSTFRRAFEGKGYVYIAKKDYPKAIENLLHYHQLVGHPLKGLSALAHAYAANGDFEKANECIEKIKLRQLEEPNVNFDLDFAFIYTGFGDYDKAYYHLDRTYDQRMGVACTGIIYCIRYPMISDGLRSDPRFLQLLTRMGLE
jgi:TolB-like protein/Flp pilus assembly protein TadD